MVGRCTGTGSCVVTIDAAKSVTADFTLKTFTLTTAKEGSGGGIVRSSPAGIDCDGDCSETYTMNTVVTLTATPDVNSNFTGWSEACSGTGSCTVTLDAAKTVTATFTLKSLGLSLTLAGNGSGTVTSNLVGINCPTDCSEPYTINTPVTLAATPDANSNFTGWSGGGCSGTTPCTVTVSVRWTGQIQIDGAETYSFNIVTHHGVRLWIDGALVVDHWKQTDHLVSLEKEAAFTAPGLHDIKLEYAENTGQALLQLNWSSSSVSWQVIPPTHLTTPKSSGSPPILKLTGEPNCQTDGLDPEIGTINSTRYNFRVTYTDSDPNPPAPGYPRVTF